MAHRRLSCSSRSRLFNDRIHEDLDQVFHGICPSLLGLTISLPVQGAFVLPVWVNAGPE